MALSFLEDLRLKANEVFNATENGENTHIRVGQAFKDIVGIFENLTDAVDAITKDKGGSVFDFITATTATIGTLILNGYPLTGIAKYPSTSDDNNDTVVTPKYITDRADVEFLSKTKDDSTDHTLKMGEAEITGDATIGGTAKSTDYTHTGFPFGKGWGAFKDDGSGASMLEVDKLFVRMKAYFAELEIRKISYLGGNYVFSSGGGKIYYVEWLDANGKILEQTEANKSLVYTFRCYLYSDDGTTQTMNWFKVDDQVRCQNFGDLSKTAKAANGVITAADYTTHYWWRRVNAVGNGVIAAKGDKKTYQYIDFQNTAGQYGADSDFPEIGDAMVQFGNWTTASRQGVIMIVVTGDDAPAIIEWQDVGANYKHFTMPEKEYTRLSPRGDGNIIRGKFISVSGTTTDNTGKSLDEQINALVDQLNDIKNQADKKFDIWFNSGDPHPNSATDKTANAPASDWTTDAEKGLHAQDLYYDTDKAPASKGGRAWRWMAHNTDGSVAYYWDEVTDFDTISALEKAVDLQNQVDDIVSDGIISHGSEKSSLLVEWNTACSNYNKYKEQVIDYSLKDEDVWKNFSKAFFNVATMLNNGADYTYPNVPVWISSDGITQDTVLSDTPCHDATEYRSKWNAYYESLAALLAAITKKAKELADSAQSTADEQKERIDDIVSDGKLDPSEKISIKRDFLAFWHELFDDNGLEDKGKNDSGLYYTGTIESSFENVVDAFNEVGTLLNNGHAWMAPSSSLSDINLPVWLRNAPTIKQSSDKNEYITDTSTVDADRFRSTWSAMYAAKSAYITLLSEYAKTLADKAQNTADDAQTAVNKKTQTFVRDSTDPPQPPYNKGDFWIQTDKKNNVMVCKTGRSSGNYVAADWGDLSDIYANTDVRTILATLADKVYALVWDDYLGKSTIRYVDVYIGSQPSSSVYDYDLSYYNGVLYKCNSSWQEVNGSGFESTFATVMSILGVIKIRVSNYTNTASPKQYDLALTQISIKDPVDGNETMGTCEIEMYNENKAWEVLRTCTLAILKNYGDHIVGLVGKLDGRVNSLSGIYATQESVNTLSQKFTFDEDGNVVNIKKSGLLTTADGNLLYAKVVGNLIMGATTGTGWYTALGDMSANGDDCALTFKGYYPIASQLTGSQWPFMDAPILRVTAGKRYVLSFKASLGYNLDEVNFVLELHFGSTASSARSSSIKFAAGWSSRLKRSSYTSDDEFNNAKAFGQLIQSSADSSRFFFAFTAPDDMSYLCVRFVEVVKRTDQYASDNFVTYSSSKKDSQTVNSAWPSTWSKTIPSGDVAIRVGNSTVTMSEDGHTRYVETPCATYQGQDAGPYETYTLCETYIAKPVSLTITKPQLEETIFTEIKDIQPSEYKAEQNIIESYIKQTADSIRIKANTVVINDKFWVDSNGDVHMNNAHLAGVLSSGSGVKQITIGGTDQNGEINVGGYITLHYDTNIQGDKIYGTSINGEGGVITVKGTPANKVYLNYQPTQITGYSVYSMGAYFRGLMVSEDGISVTGGSLRVSSISSGSVAINNDSNGYIKGARFKTETLNTSKSYAYETDVRNIICTNTSAITIQLPSSPVLGDELIIIQEGAKIDFISPSIKFKYSNRDIGTTANSDSTGQLNYFLFDGTYWHARYIKVGRPW